MSPSATAGWEEGRMRARGGGDALQVRVEERVDVRRGREYGEVGRRIQWRPNSWAERFRPVR